MKFDICIVGGCGHVGLPLGIAFSSQGKRVVLYDINKESISKVNSGIMPFKENNAYGLLKSVIANKNLVATSDIKVIKNSLVIILVIGTPVDEHLNPKVHDVIKAIKEIENQLLDNQLLVMRSTLYPGVTEKIKNYLFSRGKKTLIAFCPERIIEGHALTELYVLPQIVAGCSEEATNQASNLFKTLTDKILVTSPIEAELAKLFTNTWRYINFAISNQFYMIATKHGLDFYKIYEAMTKDYPRLKLLAKAGLTAGPCLFKDTMQLSAFDDNSFFLGHSAMLVNEGLPGFIVEAMKSKYDLTKMSVGILGMAFKADNDDSRESLSYKLKKRLEFETKQVFCHDPYIKDPSFVLLKKIKEEADIVILATPHSDYTKETWDNKIVIDIWNFYGKGGII
jgi:UDP-N-acetyl-D-mannosaminuronic acid dehydrogenase